MYALTLCPDCKRKRIIDLGSEYSKCPYCPSVLPTKAAKILFKDNDQRMVRQALAETDGIILTKKKINPDIDKISSLVYRYEHTSGMIEKAEVVASGLTEIKGTFTESDVEELIPGMGNKILQVLIHHGMITETHYGSYRHS